jgi:F-type H+-transporting ATPase subunit epsilon
VDGYFGVKAHHAPLIAALGIGEVALRLPDKSSRYFAVCGGVTEVRDNQMVVLANTGECSTDIDMQRAESAVERARLRLRGESAEDSVDVTRAQIALARAINRLRVAKHGR